MSICSPVSPRSSADSSAGNGPHATIPRPSASADFQEPPCDWLPRLVVDFEEYAANPPLPRGAHRGDPFGQLLAPLAPVIRSAQQRLRAGLTALPATAADEIGLESLADRLTSHLLGQLSRLSVRCVVLEMHRARLALELAGDTPEEQFQSFTRQLAEPRRAFEFLASYPVLAQQVMIAVEQWLASSLEFAIRLAEDRQRLQEKFFPGRSLGQVVEVQGGSGDLHCGGRSVMIVEFSGGQRVVYKPRSLAVESHFQDLLAWLNEHGATYPLRTLGIIDRGDYGWVEFVPHADADDRPAVERFYHRLGSCAALAYLLSGTDLHAENLLAHGEHPVLIDLEALFHHRLPGLRKAAAALGLTHSVLALQMLPVVSYVEGFEQPIDFSGMGATAGVPTPFRAPAWENAGRSDMRLVEAVVETPPGGHSPRLAGQPVSYRGYEATFLAGFVDAYEILRRHKRELLLPAGPLTPFAGDHVRFIARPTQVYGILLEQTLHPEAMASSDVRRRLQSRLESRTREFSCLARLLQQELADLDRNDVPLFTAPVCGRHLVTSTGETVADFFPESAWQLVQERVHQLGPGDLARQTWLITAAFAVAGQPAPPPPAPRGDLEAAQALGDRLVSLAHRAGPDIGWVTILARGRGWSIGPAGCDVATGQAGIALFLAHLARFTGSSTYRQVARQAAAAILDRLEWDAAARDALLQRDEAGCVSAALVHLAQLWGDPALERRAQDRFGQCVTTIQGSPFVQAWALLQQAVASSGSAVAAEPDRFELPGFQNGLAGQGMQILARYRGLVA